MQPPVEPAINAIFCASRLRIRKCTLEFESARQGDEIRCLDVYWIPLWAPSRQTEPTNSGKRRGAPPHVGGPHHASSLDTGRVVHALVDGHGFLSRSLGLFAPPVCFDDYEAVRVGGTGGIVRPFGSHLDVVQRRRTSTIVPTMARNLSHEHEQKHPTQGLRPPSHEGDLLIRGLGPLSG